MKKKCAHIIGGDKCHKDVEKGICPGIGRKCIGRNGGYDNGAFCAVEVLDPNIDPGNIEMPEGFMPSYIAMPSSKPQDMYAFDVVA